MNFFERKNGAGADGGFNAHLWANSEQYDNALVRCMQGVFARMFLALMITAISAFAVTRFAPLEQLVYGNQWTFMLLLIAPFGLVMAISWGINKMKASTATALFYVYSVVNGLTLSFIFIVYELGTIFQAFAVTGLMFGCMAFYGYVTKRDLSKMGSILFMALIGLIIMSVVNIFMGSNGLSWLISFGIIIVFVGLTAWDVQWIKRSLAGAVAANEQEAIKKISVIGALKLYLDFLNMFLHVLRILGRNR